MIFNYYHIINLINHREYIGITEKQPIERFKEHQKNLKRNCHCNNKLQLDWNRFGENNFKFELIESLEYDSLEDGYQHEYDLISSSKLELYNIAPGGLINPMYSEQVKQKMISTKQSQVPSIYQLQEIDENVFQIIAKFNSQKEIQRELGFNQGNIGRSIKTNSCSYGYFWINDYNIKDRAIINWKPYRIRFKPTVLVDENGNILEVHHNAREFEKIYNLRIGAVSQSIFHSYKLHGRQFKYISEEIYFQLKPLTLLK